MTLWRAMPLVWEQGPRNDQFPCVVLDVAAWREVRAVAEVLQQHMKLAVLSKACIGLVHHERTSSLEQRSVSNSSAELRFSKGELVPPRKISVGQPRNFFQYWHAFARVKQLDSILRQQLIHFHRGNVDDRPVLASVEDMRT